MAAGLGGGSSDAATALRLANTTLEEPVPPDELRELAAELGADVPFFLEDGPQVGSGDGSLLGPTDVPQDFWVLLVLPNGAAKPSTASVYRDFQDVSQFQELVGRLVEPPTAPRRPRRTPAVPRPQ